MALRPEIANQLNSYWEKRVIQINSAAFKHSERQCVRLVWYNYLKVVQLTNTAGKILDKVEWFWLREQLVVLQGLPGESLRWIRGQVQARIIMVWTTSLDRATTSWWTSVVRSIFPEKVCNGGFWNSGMWASETRLVTKVYHWDEVSSGQLMEDDGDGRIHPEERLFGVWNWWNWSRWANCNATSFCSRESAWWASFRGASM